MEVQNHLVPSGQGQQNAIYTYMVYTYTGALPLASQIENSFTCSFEDWISPFTFDQVFRNIDHNFPAIVTNNFCLLWINQPHSNVKVGIKSRSHKDQPGVIVKSYYGEVPESNCRV